MSEKVEILECYQVLVTESDSPVFGYDVRVVAHPGGAVLFGAGGDTEHQAWLQGFSWLQGYHAGQKKESE